MDVANISDIKFSSFCKLCEKIRGQKVKRKAGETLQKFMDTVMESNTESFFPILRLLLPQLDRERGPYGMKETNLARMYKRILGLPPNSSEGQRLSNFTSPSTMTTGAVGDFAEVLSCILRNRCGQGDEMTIGDVNKCLDNISLKHASHDPRGVDDEFTDMVQKMSNEEQKWVIRIVLKSMDLGLGHKKILSLYHPDANELYVLSNSIYQVCLKLKNRNIRYHELGIVLFQPFRPMLCERGDIHNFSISSPHFVETKMDGERFQIHFDVRNFKYFSRNGYEYSDNYGETPESGHFTSLIMKQLCPGVKNFILDGEMMGWHRDRKKLLPKSVNMDVKHLRLGSTIEPCFCAFDILFYNDSVLTSKPYIERIAFLEKVFTPLEGVLMNVTRSTISTIEEAFDSINKAIDNNEEGIVIKDPSSIYKPNSRKDGWLKIKPDYSEGTVDLDLLIIGGYYGTGRKRGLISSFLLGVGDDSKDEPEKFLSICKVTSGISDSELDELSSKLVPHWEKFKGQTPPFLLLKKEKPDVFIRNPRNSIILQVKSPEVVRSNEYYTEYTLRFVRVERIRYDKLWSDCLRATEFHQLRTNAAGKLTSGHIMPGPSKRKRKLQPNTCVAVPTPKVEKLSDLFSGKEICVLTGSSKAFSKIELEKIVRQNGGSISEHPGSQTFCVLFGDENVRVRNIIRSKLHNVAKYDWLLNCIKEEKLIPWNRQNLVSLNVKTEALISEQYDAFGDKHSEPASQGSLKALFNSMRSVPKCTPEEMKELDQILFSGTSPFSLFRNKHAYFDLYEHERDKSTIRPSLKNAEIIFRFLAGNVCEKINNLISYVFFDDRRLNNLSKIKQICEEKHIFCTFLSYRWITDSFKSKKIKRDEDYIIYSFNFQDQELKNAVF